MVVEAKIPETGHQAWATTQLFSARGLKSQPHLKRVSTINALQLTEPTLLIRNCSAGSPGERRPPAGARWQVSLGGSQSPNTHYLNGFDMTLQGS